MWDDIGDTSIFAMACNERELLKTDVWRPGKKGGVLSCAARHVATSHTRNVEPLRIYT